MKAITRITAVTLLGLAASLPLSVAMAADHGQHADKPAAQQHSQHGGMMEHAQHGSEQSGMMNHGQQGEAQSGMMNHGQQGAAQGQMMDHMQQGKDKGKDGKHEH